jgi:hypothetical protein
MTPEDGRKLGRKLDSDLHLLHKLATTVPLPLSRRRLRSTV